MQAGLVIEDRAVKLFFRRKVAKDHRLRHAGGLSDLFRRGAAKTTLRKQAHCDLQNLQSPLITGHAGSGAFLPDSFGNFQNLKP